MIYLRRNVNLKLFPHVLGDILQLKTIGIENCPKISQLSWSLSKLDGTASIDLSKMEGLITNVGKYVRGLASTARAFPPFFTISQEELAPYFSIYLKMPSVSDRIRLQDIIS